MNGSVGIKNRMRMKSLAVWGCVRTTQGKSRNYTPATHVHNMNKRIGRMFQKRTGNILCNWDDWENICKQKFFGIFLRFCVHYSPKHLKAELIFINTVTKEQSTGTEALKQTASFSKFSLKWHPSCFTLLSDFAQPVVLLKAPLNSTGA